MGMPLGVASGVFMLQSNMIAAGRTALSTQERFSDRAPEFFGTERETLGVGLLGVEAGNIVHLILVVGGGLVDHFCNLLGVRTFLATLRVHEGLHGFRDRRGISGVLC